MTDIGRDYFISFQTTAGIEYAEVVDIEEIQVTKVVNSPGILRARMRGNLAAIDSLVHRSQIELWRRDPDNGLDWYRYFAGEYLEPEWEDSGEPFFTMNVVGHLDKLRRRIVAYYAGTANRSKFTSSPAETVMKTLVDYNAGPNALTANSRIRNGVITGISIQADGANGNTKSWYCAWDNLLETLQKFATIGGGDFDLVKTAANAYEFRWYTGQLGTDRTSTVTFSLETGTITNPKYKYSRLEEKTVAIVGGSDSGSSRNVTTVNGADFSATNDIEIFVNASSVDTADLADQGEKQLFDVRAREEFTYDVTQTPSAALDKHYFLGDLISVINPFTGSTITQKIKEITISIDSEGEQITIGMETP